MTDTQNHPTGLTWQRCFIASLLASLPIVLAIVTMMIVERTDFPSASFFAYAIDSLGISLYQIGGGLLLWLGILYFSRHRELALGRAILIGILAEAFVRSAIVLLNFSNPGSESPFFEIAFYIVMSQFFLAPGGVMGGLLAWFYVRRTLKPI